MQEERRTKFKWDEKKRKSEEIQLPRVCHEGKQ